MFVIYTPLRSTAVVFKRWAGGGKLARFYEDSQRSSNGTRFFLFLSESFFVFPLFPFVFPCFSHIHCLLPHLLNPEEITASGRAHGSLAERGVPTENADACVACMVFIPFRALN